MLSKLPVSITGTSPLLMHSTRGMNHADPLVKELRAATKKHASKKTDDDHEEIQRLEFALGMYHDAELGPYIPSEVLLATIRDGAKAQKLGKEVIRSVFLMEEKIRLGYKGPREVERLWARKEFVDTRSAKVGAARVLRTRPKFDSWSLTTVVHFDAEHIEESQLRRAIFAAGERVGLGDYRPRFGRFEVEFNVHSR